ncbi:Serine/threonine-protein kinase PknB [Symmachiella macrocystis]|uniref:Serine/threonine-protein kinase PknB n=1 Tax=Symmachiella macrocystis TaxID=2527985 RepID=A0A5C6BP74_9PLAN|nr:serine/threonine-protein kinase [Symmachiella macrocystis]TWU13993.1 Serine/threonine-protein kinase PknB [Symmachiella macrocystis]
MASVPTRLGPFELKKQIGAGGMGVVYSAIYTKNGKKVALKLLPADLNEDIRLVKRFERELKVLQKMRHKNIVLCFGGGRKGAQKFYAMEYVDGGSMADLIRKKGRLTWEETIDYSLQLCAALEHAHDHGVVHRDLKPANLFLTKKGMLKLGDFGLARTNDATQLTAAGKTMGTFAYMSPEQICGKPPISHKTDLYAMGCVMFEMLTGKPPFMSDNPATLFHMHLSEQPPRVRAENMDCPIWLESVVQDLLAKPVDNRPLDALAVATQLEMVREKVAKQTSILENQATEKATVAGGDIDTAVAKDLLRRKKKKKRKPQLDTPIFEKTWFLVGALALLLLVVTYAVWPESPKQMFAKAEALMKTGESVDQRKALKDYLLPLAQEYPNEEFSPQVLVYIDEVEMRKAEESILTRSKVGLTEPKSEAERLYVRAYEFEQFGDRISALERYQSIVKILDENDETARPFVNLSHRQIKKIESGDTNDNRVELVRDALDRADNLYLNGETIKAKGVWKSVIALYQDNRELAPLVQRARDRQLEVDGGGVPNRPGENDAASTQ